MMRRDKSIGRQQFILLAATLFTLLVAILLLNLREQIHRDLFTQTGSHQLIVYHVQKSREDLHNIDLSLLFRQLNNRLNADKTDTLEELSSVSTFNRSVSIHALRSHVSDIIRLQKQTGSNGTLSLKLKRQLNGLLEPDGQAELRKNAGLDRLRSQIKGLILSMEQLEGLHSQHIKMLIDRQAQVTRRDTFVLFFMVATLALLSYLSITSVMGRIQSMIEEQRTLTSELEYKNAELEQFAYTVSHDLKSPLVTIKNFVGMLERDLRADDRRKVLQDLEYISTAADDMATLLEGLLELSRLGRIVNPPQSGRLNDLVERAVDRLRPKIEARGVELQVDTDMPDYWGDGLRLQEVFQNLIENAVKFMGDQPTPQIQISARLEGDEMICSVSDNGIGVHPHYNNRVFNLFERLDLSVEGTGIGLALVKRIVEAHGGSVWMESAADSRGCTAVFTLPTQ